MLIAPDRGNLHKIVVLNPKGGCGKTTLATNIAASVARSGPPPTLVDLDPQGFSTRWLERRPDDRPPIFGRSAYQLNMQGRNAVHLETHPETETLVIDLPAALTSDELQDVTYDAGSILIPVMPSAIDVVCASHFIAELLLVAQIDRRNQQLAVVANRTRQNTRSYRMLLRFLKSLHIPLVAVLRDSQSFVRAAADGIGVCEMPAYLGGKDAEQFEGVMNWLEYCRLRRQTPVTASGLPHREPVFTPTHAGH